MNKLTKVLSIFLVAGLIGTGAAVGMAGCGEENPNPNPGGDEKPPVVQTDITVPDGVTGLKVEGLTEEIALNATTTSASIDLTTLKVYLLQGATKGEEVTSANYQVDVYYNGDEQITTLTGLKKDGDYDVVVSLKNAKKADGTKAEAEGSITVTISNPITAVAVKTGTLAFKQGATVSTADWTFEATRANGDKETVTGVTVGDIDTKEAGKQTVTLTYNNKALGSVEVTVNPDENLKVQSMVLNANTLSAVVYSDDNGGHYLDEGNKFEALCTKDKAVTVEGHNKDYSEDGAVVKSFVNRIKLAGDANGIILKGINAPVAGATVKTIVTVYAISGNSTNKRFISFKKDDGALNVDQAVLLDGAEITKATFELTEAGDYTIATGKSDAFDGHPNKADAGSNGGINLYMIQVDKYITGGTGVEAQPLTGTDAVIKLSVNTEAAKKTYKANEAFSTEGVTATATLANTATAVPTKQSVALADLTFSTPDMTTLGEKEITVTYGTVKATYKITVESVVAGITGIKVTEKLANKEVDTAAGKVTLTKNDIEVALVGSDEGKAAANLASYAVSYNSADIGAGVELGVGKHTITVTAVVNGANSTTDSLAATIEIEITKKAGEGEVLASMLQFEGMEQNADSSVTTVVPAANLTGTAVTEAKIVCSSGKKGNIRTGQGTFDIEGKSCAVSFNTKGATDYASGRYIELTLAQAGKYTVTVYAKTTAAGRHVSINDGTTTTVGTNEVGNGEISATVFEVTLTGTTLLIGCDANIDIYAVVVTPVA